MARGVRKFFHKFRDKIKKMKEVLQSLVNCEDDLSVKEYFVEKNKLDRLLEQEEVYLKQRAKQFWLTEGKTNSKYFHAAASLGARYFSKCHILEAARGAGFIWAGIHKAKKVLKNGFRWFIGDGTKVDVYKDKWLREKEGFMVSQGYDHEMNTMMVNTFFYPDTRMWDAPYVRGIFNEEDAQTILNTPNLKSSFWGHVGMVYSKEWCVLC